MSEVDEGGHPEPVATVAGARHALLDGPPSWVAAPGAAHHTLEQIRQLVHATGLVCSVVNTSPPRPHVSAVWSAAKSTPNGLLGALVSSTPEWSPVLRSNTWFAEVQQSASGAVWRRELDLCGAEVAVHAAATTPTGDVVVLSGLYPWNGRLQAARQVACLCEIVEIIVLAGLTTQTGRQTGLVDLESERHGADRIMLVDALDNIDEAVVYIPAGATAMLGNRSARSRFAERGTTLTIGDVLAGPLIGTHATARALMAHRLASSVDDDRGLPRVTVLRSDDSSLTGIVAVLAGEVALPATAGGDQRSSPATAAAMMLTRREREVAELLMRGYRTAFIAEQLFVGQDTVRSHIKSMFAKLGVHSQAELVKALRDGPSGS